jgi:GTP-binding protein Era
MDNLEPRTLKLEPKMTHPEPPDARFKAGFIAIVGAPNAGKSTLLNRILGQKISITSKKPQTTRNRILGVAHRPAAQMIFFDTPGVHRPSGELNTRIVSAALGALADGDLILLVADAARPDVAAENFLLDKLAARTRPVILALNKIDLLPKPQLLEIIDRWAARFSFEAIVPVSAKHGTQLEALLAAMEAALPAGPPLYPEDTLTDAPERFIAAEMIREQVFRLTGEEIPYATAVTVDEFSEEKGGALVRILATIHLERDSQKAILIGRGGSKIKAIGEAARRQIEGMLGTRVFLKLFVRVQKNWRKDARALRKFGY